MNSVQTLFPDSVKTKLTKLRRDIHRNPELSFKEEETAFRLESELKDFGALDVRRIAGTGVVARIRGHNRKAPIVALRGDIDALPIQEETGLEFASTNAGVMHACGHDIHASWIVGAAYLLSRNPAQGDVLVLLQPAEETGKGALAVLESGALSRVTAIFGGHVDRRYPVGKVIAQEGPLAASSDEFYIDLLGRGAHGARPHEAADPIVGAGALISALQTIVSRRLNPAIPAVVTVGSIHAGTAPNVIPDHALLSGTIRAVDPKTRQQLIEEVQRITDFEAKAHGLVGRIRIEEGTPPIVNPREAVLWARSAVSAVLGDDSFSSLESTNLAAEDFAFYMEKMTGCFLRIGAREENGPFIPAHSSRFYAAEETLFIGAAVFAETARQASASLASR